MRATVAALLLVAMPAAAQEDGDAVPEPAARPPVVSSTPDPRPADLLDPEVRLPADEPEADATGVTVIDAVAVPVWEQLREDDAGFAECVSDLEALRTVFTVGGAPVTDDAAADCGIARPVTVTEIVPGVALEPAGTMRCATARALARWVDGFAVPAARTLPDRGDLVALDHGTAYLCRRRNNLPEGKISEHGFGNGIDIMRFRFASGDPIPVEPRMDEGTMEEAFQRSVRAASCLFFATVIGPGTDPAHADHLHLDVKDRRGSFRMCQ